MPQGIGSSIGAGSRFGGAVEPGGAEGVAGPGGVGEACGEDESFHLRRARELEDRVGKVGVGAALAGDEAAERGQDVVEIRGVEQANEAAGLIALKDCDFAAGAKDAVEFGEAVGVAGEVPEAEGGGDEVDGVVGEREMEGVGLDGQDVVRGELLSAAAEHVVGEVERQNRRSCEL